MEDPTKSTSTEEKEQLPATDEGAVQEPTEGAEVEKVEKVEAPIPRTYTEEEWSKRQSSIDKQLADLRKSQEETSTKLQKDYEDAITREQARQSQDYLKQVEDSGGDVDVAKKTLAREEATQRREREVETRHRAVESQQSEIDKALKAIAAQRFASEHGVDVEELLKAENPLEMENIALKLKWEKQKSEQKPPVKTDSGVPSAKGIDYSKMSPQEKVLKGIEGMQL